MALLIYYLIPTEFIVKLNVEFKGVAILRLTYRWIFISNKLFMSHQEKNFMNKDKKLFTLNHIKMRCYWQEEGRKKINQVPTKLVGKIMYFMH